MIRVDLDIPLREQYYTPFSFYPTLIHCGFVYPVIRSFCTNSLDVSILVVVDDSWNLGGSGNRLLRRKSGRRKKKFRKQLHES